VFFDGNNWISIKIGESVGHKRIIKLNKEMLISKVRLNVDIPQNMFLEARNCLTLTNELQQELNFLEDK